MRSSNAEPDSPEDFSQMNEAPRISFIELAITLANANDIFTASKAIIGASLAANDSLLQSLKTQMLALVLAISEHLAYIFRSDAIETTKALEKAGLGGSTSELLAALEVPHHTEARCKRYFQEPYKLNFMGMWLCQIRIEKQIRDFVTAITKIKERRTKLTDKEQSDINDILLAFSNTQRYADLAFPLDELQPILAELKKTMSALVTQHQLKEFVHIAKAFQEALTVNTVFTRFILSDDEIHHMGTIISEHYQALNLSIPSIMLSFVSHLNKIKPIYSLTLPDLHRLLNNSISGKADFLAKNFTAASAPMYNTYQGLSYAIACYNELKQIINTRCEKITALIATSASDKQKTALATQIETLQHYSACITEYFQKAARFVMPINDLYAKLHEVANQARFQNSDIAELLSFTLSKLSPAVETLRLKTLTVNALATKCEFIRDIEVLLEVKRNKSALQLLFSWKTEKWLLLSDLKVYLESKSQSERTEDVTNYHEIVDAITGMLDKYKISLDDVTQNPNDRSLTLLGKIYNTYSTLKEKYQSAHVIPVLR